MALARGYEVAIRIDDSAGTLRDISDFITSVRGFLQEVAELETTAFGDADRTRIGGIGNSTFGIDGFWDDTTAVASPNPSGTDTVLNNLPGIVGTFNYVITATDAGTITYSGECLCLRYSIDAPVDGIITISADFAIDGAVSRA